MKTTVAAGVALALFYCVGIFDHNLWTPDEPRVASIARQVSEGAWIAPTLNGTPFLEQPPLFYWCVASFFRLFGPESPYLARSIAAVFCLGGALFTFLLASALAPESRRRSVGFLAVLALGLTLEYYHTAHRLVVDSALVCFTTGSAYGLLRLFHSDASRQRLLWACWAALLAGLAFLTKGVIGIAVPALFWASLAVASRRPGLLWNRALWCTPFVFAAVVGPWLWLLCDSMGTVGLEELFLDNTLARVVPSLAGDRAHVRPLYYYLILPVHLFPAVLFGLGGVLHRFSPAMAFRSTERWAYDVAILWFLFGFLMLSLASTKRAIYFLPFFPACAVAGGLWLDAYVAGRQNGRYEKFMDGLLCVILFLFAGVLPFAPTLAKRDMPWSPLLLGAALGLAGTVACVIFARRMHRRRLLTAWTTAFALTAVCAVVAAVPAFDRDKSLREVSERIAKAVPSELPLYAYSPDETTLAMMPLYTGRPVVPVLDATALDALLDEGSTIYVLAVDKTYRTRKRRFEAITPFRPVVLLADDRPSSRAFRLYRLQKTP